MARLVLQFREQVLKRGRGLTDPVVLIPHAHPSSAIDHIGSQYRSEAALDRFGRPDRPDRREWLGGGLPQVKRPLSSRLGEVRVLNAASMAGQEAEVA
jgi:hypothetical protein